MTVSESDPRSVREHLALALDVDDLDRAATLAAEVGEYLGVAKIGLELYAAAGPSAFDRLHAEGFAVFADLKLHDIPTTVEKAARVVGRYGVEYLNFHAAGGETMLRGAAHAYRESARAAGVTHPVALAVTVLTSDVDTRAFPARLDAARASGCDGVVCSAHELAIVRTSWPEAVTMVPGIRLAGEDANDQARVASPADVARDGGTCAVIGRTVTHAIAPRDAARQVAESFLAGLTARRAP